MNFLFPLYLLGAAAVLVPIVLHLRRRPPRELTEFSSLMFLEATPLQRKRRRRLENLLLLLMRCALILLLAMLFSRPFFRGEALPNAVREGREMLVLVDRSASMQREDLWAQAVKRAVDCAGDAAPGDRLSLVVFDRSPAVLVDFDRWKETPVSDRAGLFSRELERVGPGWEGTDLAAGVTFAVELLEENLTKDDSGKGDGASGAPRVILISDLQEGGGFAALESLAWPEGAELALETVEARSEDNASVHLLSSEGVLSLARDRDKEVASQGAGAEASGPRVRIVNERASGREDFSLRWADRSGDKTPVRVGAGMQRTLQFPLPEEAKQGEVAELILEGDDHAFDNRLFLAGEAQRPLRIIYFGGEEISADDTSQPLYYLKRAVQPTRLHDPRVSSEIPEGLNLPETADFIVVGGAVDEEKAGAIAAYLAGGGWGLLLLRDPGQGALLGKLLDTDQFPVEDALLESEYVLLEGIDFENPLLAAFTDARVRDFSRIHFWKYRKLKEGHAWPDSGKVLARFDSGDPAWISFPVGMGELVVMTSAWHPGDSQLALSTKFVPLLYSMMERGRGGHRARAAQFFVGDSLPAAAGAVVRRPDGKEAALAEGADFYPDTDVPGVYRVTLGGEEMRFAVNLAPEESRIMPLDAERFAEAGIVLARRDGVGLEARAAAVSPERKKHLLNAEMEKRQQFWRWLVLGALVVVFLEMVIAGTKPQPADAETV